MSPERTISTVPRFLYLNTYAFLLMFMGIGIVLIPLYRISLWFTAGQIILFLISEKNAVKLFRSWKDKKRKYRVLMEKNTDEFRPDTFTEFVQAPCGRLLTRVVLADLGKSDCYHELMKLRKPFIDNLKSGCSPKKTVIYSQGKKL